MNIVQNLLPNDYKIQLQEILLGNTFPWHWQDGVIKADNCKENTFQLVHSFFNGNGVNSGCFNLIEPMFSYIRQSTEIDIKKINRIKANLLPRQVFSNEDVVNAIHTDVFDASDERWTSFVYYLHDVDGDINTYDKDYNIIDSYSPKENSLVWFKSNILHGTRPPIKSKRRVCINFVLSEYD
jgi:hypothetical protein